MTAQDVQCQLEDLANPEQAAQLQRYFKTGPGEYGAGDRFRGIRVSVLRKIARANRQLPLAEVEQLLHSPFHEDRLTALLIMVQQYARADEAMRSRIYTLYMDHTAYINNWDLVDTSAEHIAGAHLLDLDKAPLTQLARSPSLWERRIAIMATFHYIKQGRFEETLRLAELLLNDGEDLIHKAVGWMLREIGERNRAVEEQFLRQHYQRMPRTMLRYAIEKFPSDLRQAYLKGTTILN